MRKEVASITTFFLATVFIIMLSGCANSFGTMVSGSRTNNDVVPKANVGGKGVEIFWLDNAPPEVVQKGSRFQIGIELQNRGYEDVKDGILRVWSCKNIQLQGSEVSKSGIYRSSFDLKKSDINNPVGGMTRKYFSGTGIDADESCYIHAQACYIYQTHVSQQVCLDPDPYTESSAKPCSFSNDISVPSQGAPVVVDNIKVAIVDETDSTVTFQFSIYAKNAGTGQVVADDAMKDVCEGGNDKEASERINIVKMNARMGTLLLECSPDEITLIEDEKKRMPFTCTYQVEKDRGVFPTVLSVNLYYGYIQGSDVDVKIEGERNEVFGPAPVCPPENCKTRGVWGVCNEVYGGFQEDKSCEDQSKVCCRESLPLCERKYGSEGYKCVEGCKPDPDKKNTCPGAQGCCKVTK